MTFTHEAALPNYGRVSLRWRRSVRRGAEHAVSGSPGADLPSGEANANIRFAAGGTAARAAQQEQARLLQAANNAVQFAVEQERLRIARDIHDHVGQHLVGIMLRLAALEYRINEPSLRSSLRELRPLIAQFGEELKAVSAGEACGVPSGGDLIPALERLAGDWERTTGIRTFFDCKIDGSIEMSDAVAEVAYRVVQEALTNVAKHAQSATCAKICLHSVGWSLRLSVEDNGRGPQTAPVMARRGPGVRRGIAGMRERVAALGGSLEIGRIPRRGGMRLLVNIPLWQERNQAWGSN